MITLSPIDRPRVRIISESGYKLIADKSPSTIYAIYKKNNWIGVTFDELNLTIDKFPSGTLATPDNEIVLPEGYLFYGGTDEVSGSATNKLNITNRNGNMWVYNKSGTNSYWTMSVPLSFSDPSYNVSAHPLQSTVTVFVGNPPSGATTLPSTVWANTLYETHGISGPFIDYGRLGYDLYDLDDAGYTGASVDPEPAKYSLRSDKSNYRPNIGWDPTQFRLYVDDMH